MQGLIEHSRDTGAGPDGIVYGYYQTIPEAWQHTLYELYLYLWNGGLPHDDFNQSRIVLPPKGKDVGDATGKFVRPAKRLRPLSLSNTDAKHISSLVATPLNELASRIIGNYQIGGIKGRQFTEHILSLEAKLVDFTLRRAPKAGIFALDQEAAFPNLSRRYMMWVLKRMRVPRPARRIIKALYMQCSGVVCLCGRLFGSIRIESGVKQGDPSSMVLFILAFDPILRWIQASLSPLPSWSFGMCDDLAIATLDIPAAWAQIIRIFVVVRRFASLFINQQKTHFVFACHPDGGEVYSQMLSCDPGLSLDNVGWALKYFGIYLGPRANEHQWVTACDKYKEMVLFIKALGAGLITAVVLYNTLAVPTFSYVGSFVKPAKEILRLESRGQQMITNGPWNAFPRSLLNHLKMFGFRVGCTPVSHASIRAGHAMV